MAQAKEFSNSLTSLFTGHVKPQNTEEGLCHSTSKPWDTPLATTFFDLLLYTTSFDLLFYLSLLRLSKSPSEGRGYILAMVGHMAITHSPLILNMLAVTQRGEGISFTKADVCQVNDSWWQLMTSDRQFWSGKEIQMQVSVRGIQPCNSKSFLRIFQLIWN